LTYVALGDSYTAGPLVPMPTGKPIDCGRSDHNYPSLLAEALKVAAFRDVSCGSAATMHFTHPQTGLQLGGTNPPQFNALGPDASIVTVGIGGNDIGLGAAVINCIRVMPKALAKPPCADAMTAGGRDEMGDAIVRAAPSIDAALAGIRQRAPAARIFVVGYPHMFPDTGDGCWPYVPFLPADVVYLRAKLVQLNAMLADRAAASGATFVDTYTSSAGHDPCQLPGTAWVNGAVVVPLSYVMHPNELDMANVARLVLAAIRV
jgi:lysophospholipase L1-like esterase